MKFGKSVQAGFLAFTLGAVGFGHARPAYAKPDVDPDIGWDQGDDGPHFGVVVTIHFLVVPNGGGGGGGGGTGGTTTLGVHGAAMGTLAGINEDISTALQRALANPDVTAEDKALIQSRMIPAVGQISGQVMGLMAKYKDQKDIRPQFNADLQAIAAQYGFQFNIKE